MRRRVQLRQRARSGLWAMLAAVGFFSLMDAGLKLLAARYPPMQVAALRGGASLPLVLAWAGMSVGFASLLHVRWRWHLLRGVMAVLMMAGFVYALRELPLTTAYTLFFVAPLLITALSGPVLGERVGWQRWCAIAMGFVGVLVVMRPSGNGIATLAGAAVLASALGYAVSAMIVRVLARTDSTQAMVVWMLAMLTLGAGALAAPGWRALHWSDAPVIAAVGVCGALGQWTITEAFRRAEASAVAPLEYSALVWGLGLDLAFWGVLPDAVTWAGAAIIVLSGLFLLRRENTHCEAEHP